MLARSNSNCYSLKLCRWYLSGCQSFLNHKWQCFNMKVTRQNWTVRIITNWKCLLYIRKYLTTRWYYWSTTIIKRALKPKNELPVSLFFIFFILKHSFKIRSLKRSVVEICFWRFICVHIRAVRLNNKLRNINFLDNHIHSWPFYVITKCL